jgi:hypothetical protein
MDVRRLPIHTVRVTTDNGPSSRGFSIMGLGWQTARGGFMLRQGSYAWTTKAFSYTCCLLTSS